MSQNGLSVMAFVGDRKGHNGPSVESLILNSDESHRFYRALQTLDMGITRFQTECEAVGDDKEFKELMRESRIETIQKNKEILKAKENDNGCSIAEESQNSVVIENHADDSISVDANMPAAIVPTYAKLEELRTAISQKLLKSYNTACGESRSRLPKKGTEWEKALSDNGVELRCLSSEAKVTCDEVRARYNERKTGSRDILEAIWETLFTEQIVFAKFDNGEKNIDVSSNERREANLNNGNEATNQIVDDVSNTHLEENFEEQDEGLFVSDI